MLCLEKLVGQYLEYCRYQKNLNAKTLKAYGIDLSQFVEFMKGTDSELNRSNLTGFITKLHKRYKPKSIKRKIASLKAFCGYLEYEELLDKSPFSKMRVKFQEPFLLPKTIPLRTVQAILSTAYGALREKNSSEYQHRVVLRDIAVLELLFATGARVSELCSLSGQDVDIKEGNVQIYGKGSKERVVQIANQEVLTALKNYQTAFEASINGIGYFFVNRLNQRLSEQSVRFMVNKYVALAGIALHITPHMFRHSFATLLLEEDVDIRYIQQLLGHSSIVTTQIYTHVTAGKQRDILTVKHPRNKIVL